MSTILRNKLKLEIEKSGLTISAVAQSAGLTQGYVSQLLSPRGGRTIDRAKALKILVDGLGWQISKAKDFLARLAIDEEKQNLMSVDPVIDSKDLSAFAKLTLVKLTIELLANDFLTSSADFILVPGALVDGEDDTIALEVGGQFAGPTLPNGSVAITAKSAQYIPGRLHLFRFGQEWGLGRIVKGSDYYEVQEANHNFPKIPINNPDFAIVGNIIAKYQTNP